MDESVVTVGNEIQQTNTDILTNKEQEWKVEHEKILVEWADKAMCYRWLHARSHQSYSTIHTWFTIPVIIMSTLTGTANFAQDKFPDDIKTYAQMGIGAVNIFAGILTTIAQFLKIGELNEAHRASSISWDKFYRNIKVELAKSREERLHVGHMLKMCKEEFDRLMETSPSITEKIISQFNTTFPQKKQLQVNNTTGNPKPDIKRPEICNELISTAEIMFITNEDDSIASSQASIIEMTKRKKLLHDSYEKEAKSWSIKFEEKHNRKPLESELIDNLQDKINPDYLHKIIKGVLKEFDEISDENVVNNV
jgi:hypothetical protein